MAQLLVIARDDGRWFVPAISIKYPRVWKPGDIVGVFPDSWRPGREESKAAWVAAGNRAQDWHGRFYVISVPDLRLSDGVTLTYQAVDDQVRRQYAVDFSLFTPAQRNALQLDGEITLSRADIRGVFRRKSDGAIGLPA